MWRLLRRRGPKADKSTEAVCEAQKSLKKISERHDEVREVSDALKKIRRENHFSEHLTRIMMEGTK